MHLCFATLLSHPDGTYEIENGVVNFTPRLPDKDLIEICVRHINKHKVYELEILLYKLSRTSSAYIDFSCP